MCFFMPKKERTKRKHGDAKGPQEVRRVPLPGDGEMFAIAVQMLGHDKLKVQCEDGQSRVARIPGRLRKRVWIRPGDVIVVAPWVDLQSDRADVTYRYTRTQASWLERKGYLKNLL